MNTKGIKFLAVLAVLAMAFAAFAVMTDTEQNSAAIPEEVTTVSTEEDFRAAITGDKEFNVKLGDDIVLNDSSLTGYLVKSAGIIDFNGYTITVQKKLSSVTIADETLNELVTADSNDNGKMSVIVNGSEGLILKDTSSKGEGGIILADTTMDTTGGRSGMAAIFNLPDGVVTIESGIYKVDNGKIEDGALNQTTNNYWYTIKNLGTMTINGGYIGGMNHYWGAGGSKASSAINSGWEGEVSEGEVVTLTINDGTIDFGLNAVKAGTLSYVLVNGGIFKNSLQYSVMAWDKVTINDVTLVGNNAGLSISKLPNTETSTGEMTINTNLTFKGPSRIGYGDEGYNGGATLIVNGTITTSGDITCNDGVITGNGQIKTTGNVIVGDGYDFCLAGKLKLTILEGATVPAGVIFAYEDEYNDTHSFSTNKALDVGIGDFTIAAGQNKLTVDGTVTLTAATTYTCEGNVTLSGMVYKAANFTATENTADLTLENVTEDRSGSAAPADIKLGTFQVTDGGSVALSTSVLVEAGCSFYVSGDLTVGVAASGDDDDDVGSDAILKIAEGAVVKPEGTLTLNGKSAIWNAGKFIATGYGDGGAYDKQLVRVFMNTGYQTGTYYLGSSVYDGVEAGQIPLTVAFGSYIDMTGIDKVNLTSGGIDVNSALYKYKTLILATFDNTIALTATYDNQYPVTVTLDGKSAATPVMTAKSATINNVVWQSPISATLYVTAPEVYTVVLAKEIVENEETGVYAPDNTKNPYLWTSGLTIKDQNGRTIPIAADGTIKVVFGYQYTIEGTNSTSNYKFFSPNGDLTDLTKVDKTKGTFTMIRNNVYDEDNKEIPVVLYITEGYAVELTVYLDDKDKKYSVGDVFMYYNVANDEGKVVGDGTPVTVELDKDEKKVGIITGIYSNDTIYFKSEFVKFFKSTAIANGAKKIVFPSHEENVTNPEPGEATTKTVYDDVKLSSEKFEQAFTFSGITKKENKASFTLECKRDTVEVTFIFDQYNGELTPPTYIDEDQKITVKFTTYCDELEHSDSISRTLSETIESQTPGMFVITMAVGEVYTVSWTDITGYLSTMTYVNVEDEDVKYKQGTSVTVSEALEYTLYEEKLNYITVENQTNYDLTITIGEFTSDVKAKRSNNQVVVNDGDTNPAILSKKGYTVNDWKFQTKENDADASPEVYVSGTMTVKDLVKATTPSTPIKPEEDGYFSKMPTADDKFTLIITETHVQIITYTVDVEADDHAKITNYDNSGQLGQPRKAYVQPYAEYTVIGVEYEYQEVGMTEKAVGQAVKKTSETTGQEYWEYIMPASNVVLKPISQKETRNLSFVDENGEPIEDATKVEPTTQVNMPVPCKPLSEIVSVTTESQIDYVYNPVTGYISFEMPDEDVVFVVTCKEIDYSTDVIVTVGQKGMPITLVITALDGKQIASGTIKMNVTYTYTDEDGEISTDVVTVTKNYVAGESTVIVDQEFITLLGDNYSGAFAVTGTFEFGYAVGSLSKTVYTPVLGA